MDIVSNGSSFFSLKGVGEYLTKIAHSKRHGIPISNGIYIYIYPLFLLGPTCQTGDNLGCPPSQ